MLYLAYVKNKTDPFLIKQCLHLYIGYMVLPDYEIVRLQAMG